MYRDRNTAKDVVRIRSGNQCEKCGCELDRNDGGSPKSGRSRSIHHRRPVRDGGRDAIGCMVNLCITCHKGIHADEDAAAKDGWIILGRNPCNTPFKSYRGWVLPDDEGGLTLLDWEAGYASVQVVPPARPRTKQQTRRPRYDKRSKARRVPRAA